jgi:ABC-type sugar transport system permease subunit
VFVKIFLKILLHRKGVFSNPERRGIPVFVALTIGFIAFTFLLITASIVVAFSEYDIFTAPLWVGLKNFTRMFFRDLRYWRSVKATFFYGFTAIPLRLFFALLVAMLLSIPKASGSTDWGGDFCHVKPVVSAGVCSLYHLSEVQCGRHQHVWIEG